MTVPDRGQAPEGARASLVPGELGEARFRLLVESVRDYAIVLLDREGTIASWNVGAERAQGYAAAEIVGRHFSCFYRDDEVRAGKCEEVLRVAAREGRFEEEGWRLRKDGSSFWANVVLTALRDDDGGLIGFAKITRDLTEQKGAEEERARIVTERRMFLADVTATLGASLDCRTTLARVVDLAVPRFADWCAIDLAEAPGSPAVRVAVAHLDPARLKLADQLAARSATDAQRSSGVNNVIRTGKPELHPVITDEMLAASITDAGHLAMARSLQLSSIVIVPLACGTRVFGALSLAFAESGRRYTHDDVAFAEDLARRTAGAIENARVFAAEQHAREAADAANRAKDEFLASVSHELRTPLNAILGWARLLNANLAEDKRARAAETIERNAVAMTQLIEDLLDVSRIVSGKMRLDLDPVDLEPVIEAALETVRGAARAKGVHLESVLEPTTGPILGDAARLQQIVWNLVSNGVKYTPKGGRVSVRLREDEAHLEIVVTDTGRGIDAAFLPHVFDAFRQADGSMTRSAGGLGLGLAIVKNLVELHGGSIEAWSAGKQHGATFTVRLPVPPARPAQASGITTATAGVAPLPQLQGLRVLVVDDERDARELVRSVLEMSGSVVLTAASVEEAMAWFEREAPDVLLSDIGMPGENGYDLMRRVRALPPERGGLVPAAALTAFARAEDRRRVFSSGFLMHVAKPVEPAELVTVVAALARDVARRSA